MVKYLLALASDLGELKSFSPQSAEDWKAGRMRRAVLKRIGARCSGAGTHWERSECRRQSCASAHQFHSQLSEETMAVLLSIGLAFKDTRQGARNLVVGDRACS